MFCILGVGRKRLKSCGLFVERASAFSCLVYFEAEYVPGVFLKVKCYAASCMFGSSLVMGAARNSSAKVFLA